MYHVNFINSYPLLNDNDKKSTKDNQNIKNLDRKGEDD